MMRTVHSNSNFSMAIVTVIAILFLKWSFVNADDDNSNEWDTLTANIEGSIVLPNYLYRAKYSSYFPSRVVLNNGERSTYPTGFNLTFTLEDVPLGRHLLEVYHPLYSFTPVVIDILPHKGSRGVKILCYNQDLEHIKGSRVRYPLILSVNSAYEFFQPQWRLNILGLLKSPMIIVSVVCLALMVLMSKVHESVSPDEIRAYTTGENVENPPQSVFMKALKSKNGSGTTSLKKSTSATTAVSKRRK